MAKKLQIDTEGELDYVPEIYRTGTSLSEVKKISPSELKINSLNSTYFQTESTEYFENLREDVRKRGIIVPLIAKKDGTLLSGHNRLQIAIELELKRVPVMYVLEDLSEDREREMLIKDNLYRRQLNQSDWISLYKRLYPEFESTYLNPEATETRGRKNGTGSITLEQIAGETGQTVGAIKSQIKRTRDKISGKPPAIKNNSFTETIAKPEGVSHNSKGTLKNSFNETISLPDSEVRQTKKNSFNETISDLTNLQTTLRHIEEFYLSSEPDTRKDVENTLALFMGRLSLLSEH